MSRMKYLKSAVLPKDYPDADRPEVAVAGRSNAGKSSFINCLAKAKVAHVSQVPGKTKLLNFFDFAKYRYVDTPGYGFAARSSSEIVQWNQMMEAYLAMRENLAGLVLLMDIRRSWDEEEQLLKTFCDSNDLPMILVLTKADKCKRAEVQKFLKQHQKDSQVPVFVISSLENKGIEDLEEYIFQEWISPALKTPAVKGGLK